MEDLIHCPAGQTFQQSDKENGGNVKEKPMFLQWGKKQDHKRYSGAVDRADRTV